MGDEDEKEGVHDMSEENRCVWTGDYCILPYDEVCTCKDEECPYYMSREDWHKDGFKKSFQGVSRDAILELLYQERLKSERLAVTVGIRDAEIERLNHEAIMHSWETNPDGMGK